MHFGAWIGAQINRLTVAPITLELRWLKATGKIQSGLNG